MRASFLSPALSITTTTVDGVLFRKKTRQNNSESNKLKESRENRGRASLHHPITQWNAASRFLLLLKFAFIGSQVFTVRPFATAQQSRSLPHKAPLVPRIFIIWLGCRFMVRKQKGKKSALTLGPSSN